MLFCLLLSQSLLVYGHPFSHFCTSYRLTLVICSLFLYYHIISTLFSLPSHTLSSCLLPSYGVYVSFFMLLYFYNLISHSSSIEIRLETINKIIYSTVPSCLLKTRGKHHLGLTGYNFATLVSVDKKNFTNESWKYTVNYFSQNLKTCVTKSDNIYIYSKIKMTKIRDMFDVPWTCFFQFTLQETKIMFCFLKKLELWIKMKKGTYLRSMANGMGSATPFP